MKKYTITIFAVLGTLALIYVIVDAVNYFKFLHSKPIVTQISNNDENLVGNRKKLQIIQ